MSFESPEKEKIFRYMTGREQKITTYDLGTNNAVIAAIQADIKDGWFIAHIIVVGSSKYHVVWERRNV